MSDQTPLESQRWCYDYEGQPDDSPQKFRILRQDGVNAGAEVCSGITDVKVVGLVMNAPKILAALRRVAHPNSDDSDLDHAQKLVASLRHL